VCKMQLVTVSSVCKSLEPVIGVANHKCLTLNMPTHGASVASSMEKAKNLSGSLQPPAWQLAMLPTSVRTFKCMSC
jgi:hypothetical protein